MIEIEGYYLGEKLHILFPVDDNWVIAQGEDKRVCCYWSEQIKKEPFGYDAINFGTLQKRWYS
jgi:hypothetical protein